MPAKPLFPLVSALINEGVIRSFLKLPLERRKEIRRGVIVNTISSALGTGIGSYVTEIIRVFLERSR